MKSLIPSNVSLLLAAPVLHAVTVSQNSGSLGSAANGTNSNQVSFVFQSPLAAGGDSAAGYAGGGAVTAVPYLAALNPSAAGAFTIEFWANPSASDNDDVPVTNRFATGNRSGWTFFQRATGWNFRMYNGDGGNVGWDLTGGTSILNTWSHVVATWDGSSALLYVNGSLVDSTNDSTATLKTYNPNGVNTPTLNVGANFDGGSPSTGLVDEVAFYSSALSAGQISNHYNLSASPTAGAYANAVLGDGALLYLQNIPEPGATSLTALAVLGALGRRRRA